jgi:GNAT superfamily N-acetyltransferase
MNENITIRPVEAEELHQVLDLFIANCPEVETDIGELNYAFDDDSERIQVAVSQDNGIIGVAWYTEWDVDGIGAHVVVVDQAFRGNGLGRRLLQELDPATNGRKYSCFSLRDTEFAAIHFLRNNGYVVVKSFEFVDEHMYLLRKDAAKSTPIQLAKRLKWRMT